MKGKNLIISLAVAAALIVGIIFIAKPSSIKRPAKKAATLEKTKQDKVKKAPTPPKKTFSKDMGGLTLKVIDSKGKEMHLRAMAFKSEDAKSSIYVTSFMANRMQELLPGNYDIEIDTLPQKIYKNISVSKEKETIHNLGCITGSVNIKALNSKKKEGYYPIRAFDPKSNILVANGSTNRPIEIIAGTYDIEVGILPRLVKKNVILEKNKETVIDLGCVAGMLLVKAVDENKKAVRYSLRVKKAGSNEQVTFGVTNNPIEISEGKYDIEVLSRPSQVKSGIDVKTGEEPTVEFIIPSVQK